MLISKKIAVTGGIASGKSTACRFFQGLGAYVVSADQIVHELLDPTTDLGRQVLHLLGSEIAQNGQIDRHKVAEKVFQDAALLRKLEQILHPAVLQRIDEQYQKILHEGKFPLFVVEMPLLFEIGAEGQFDAVVAIFADETISKKRCQMPQEYDPRMQRQLGPHIKAAKATYTIKNNGSLSELRHQIEKLYATIIGKP